MWKRKSVRKKKSDKCVFNVYGGHPKPAAPAVKSNIVNVRGNKALIDGGTYF